jgi:hypothetical protein
VFLPQSERPSLSTLDFITNVILIC